MKQILITIACLLIAGCATRQSALKPAPAKASLWQQPVSLRIEPLTDYSPTQYKLRLWVIGMQPGEIWALTISTNAALQRSLWTDYLYVFGSTNNEVLVERPTSRQIWHRVFGTRKLASGENMVTLPDRDSIPLPEEIDPLAGLTNSAPVWTNGPPPLPTPPRKNK